MEKQLLILFGLATALVLFLSFAMFHSPLTLPAVKLYTGVYREAFEESVFTPCNSKQSWWVLPHDAAADEQFRYKLLPYKNYGVAVVYVTFEGVVDGRDKVKFVSAHEHVLFVNNIKEVTGEIPDNCKYELLEHRK